MQRPVHGKTRRFTLGPHGVLTCDEARMALLGAGHAAVSRAMVEAHLLRVPNKRHWHDADTQLALAFNVKISRLERNQVSYSKDA